MSADVERVEGDVEPREVERVSSQAGLAALRYRITRGHERPL